jgi:hypothetical protein
MLEGANGGRNERRKQCVNEELNNVKRLFLICSLLVQITEFTRIYKIYQERKSAIFVSEGYIVKKIIVLN